jgi:hypothetical protein
MGRFLWREDGYVVYSCCWSSPAQSYSGPSRVGLVTIFYCLRLETSLSVASYDSQGYGRGIRPRLHAGHKALTWGLRPDFYRLFLTELFFITTLHRPNRRHRVNNSSIVACIFVAAGTCLPSRCLAMNVYSGSTIPAFRRHVTISSWHMIRQHYTYEDTYGETMDPLR